MPFSKDENRHSGYPDKCFLICNETKSFTFQGMVSVGGHVDIVCASIYVKILQLTSFAATFEKDMPKNQPDLGIRSLNSNGSY